MVDITHKTITVYVEKPSQLRHHAHVPGRVSWPILNRAKHGFADLI
jgi:hypothetical protein